MQDKKYFCYEIYKNLAVWSRNGKIGYNPCSFFSGYIKTSDKLDINDVWNSAERAELKRCVENDIPIPGCSTCYRQEANNLASRRQGAKIQYETFHQDTNIDLTSPQSIDYSVGNLCNLKCVICGPDNSSQWLPDYQKMFPTADLEVLKYKKLDQMEIQNEADLVNVNTVHFHGGGEPLLSSNHFNLLQKIKNAKGLSDVRVFYNTNGTQIVSDEVLKIWEECKLVELYFSIDDIGPRFDYQRTGASWADVNINLKWFYENMPHNHMFKVNCCWGYLNLYYLDELYQWWETEFNANRYGDRTNLIFQKVTGKYAINHLSENIVDILNKKFSKYNELLSIVNTLHKSNNSHKGFWENIQKLDAIRDTNFKDVHQEWSQLLSEEAK